MTSPRIRPIAICVFHRAGRILVNETEEDDPLKPRTFCRPLGGGIEFGETSAEAIVREIREELGAEVGKLNLIGTLENIFTCLGRPGHEIVQVYNGEFMDQGLYEMPCLSGREDDGVPFEAYWRGKSYFSATLPLYPEGLAELLEQRGLFGT